MCKNKCKWNILALLLLLLSVNFTWAQEKLTVVVKNIRNKKGHILVALFKDEKTFLTKFEYGKRVIPGGSEVIVEFENVPPGEYGLSVIHDENDNGVLDKKGIGIPREGFGFGNNAMGKFGPPDFEEAKIKWEGTNKTEEMILRYY